MAERRPLVRIGGQIKQLPSSDTLPPQPPAAHGHSISDVAGLRAELDSLAGGGGGGGGLPEAPIDGKTYGRMNGAWVRVIGMTDNPAGDLKNYLLGTPSAAELDTMLESLYWRIGYNDLLAQPAELTAVFADAEAMLVLCTAPKAYKTIMQHANASVQFMASTALTVVTNPVMTSATTPSGEASASSIYSTGYVAFYAFNEASNYWASQSGAPINQQWIRYDFPTPVFLHSINVAPGIDQSMKDYRLEYSDNGTTWATAMTGVFAQSNAYAIHKIENAVGKHRFWRIAAVTGHGGSYVSLSEIKFRGFNW